MRSIMMTYPGFQSLPRGIRKMLLVSETFFFVEARRPSRECRDGLVTAKAPLHLAGDDGWTAVFAHGPDVERLPRLAA